MQLCYHNNKNSGAEVLFSWSYETISLLKFITAITSTFKQAGSEGRNESGVIGEKTLGEWMHGALSPVWFAMNIGETPDLGGGGLKLLKLLLSVLSTRTPNFELGG